MATTKAYCKSCDFSLSAQEIEAGLDTCLDCADVPAKEPGVISDYEEDEEDEHGFI